MTPSQIDPKEIQVWPLSQRKNELRLEAVWIDPFKPPPAAGAHKEKLDLIAERTAWEATAII